MNRCTGLPLRGGRSLKNRVVVPPMASETADAQGRATEATLLHYKQLAASGAGLVMVEYTYVHDSGKSEDRQLGLTTDAHVEGLREIVARIHRAGALAGLQLTHSGGKNSQALTGGELQSPSGIPVPARDHAFEASRAMSAGDIETWKASFRSAFARARQAGFDLVELHAAHGYGLNQWLSPLTNQRTDAYGGSADGRARLLLEILADARREHPELLLAVRMPGQDFLEGGLSQQDAQALAQALEKVGVDLLDVSSGIGGWRRPRDRVGEGYLVGEASAVQSAVRLPVIGVGGIETGAYIDRALSTGSLALAAVGRAILKDPQAWGRAYLYCEPASLKAPV